MSESPQSTLERPKLFDQDAPENQTAFVLPEIQQLTKYEGGTEVMPAQEGSVDTIDASAADVAHGGLRKVWHKLKDARSARRAVANSISDADADSTEDVVADEEPAVENAFTKFTRESRELRGADKTRAERRAERKDARAERKDGRKAARAERRQARDEEIAKSIDDQGNALPREDKKVRGESKLRQKAQALKSRLNTKATKISNLENELEGASSTIAVMKKDADGNKVYQRVHTSRTYKEVGTGVFNKAGVEKTKKVRMTNADIDAYEAKVEELNGLRSGKKANKETAQAAQDMSEDEFTQYLDTLSDEQTTGIQKLMDSNDSVKETLENMSNSERKIFIESWIVGQDRKAARAHRRKMLRHAPLAAAVAVTNKLQERRDERAENGETHSKGKKIAIAVGALAAVGAGVYAAHRFGLTGSNKSANTVADNPFNGASKAGTIDREHVAAIAAEKARKATENANALAEFRQSEHAVDAATSLSGEKVAKAKDAIEQGKVSWAVAHELAPGREGATIQPAIDKYNSLNGTHFALTPHGDSTWIMDGSHAISPEEMKELDKLMII